MTKRGFYLHGEGLCLGSRESWPETSTFINLEILVMLILVIVIVAVTGNRETNVNTGEGDVEGGIEGHADGGVEGDVEGESYSLLSDYLYLSEPERTRSHSL